MQPSHKNATKAITPDSIVVIAKGMGKRAQGASKPLPLFREKERLDSRFATSRMLNA